jgi:hypothetical protein
VNITDLNIGSDKNGKFNERELEAKMKKIAKEAFSALMMRNRAFEDGSFA